MEIKLQGSSIYNVKDWNGSVDIQSLKLFQLKRLAGNRNISTLFRKIVKILSGNNSPVSFPKEIATENLDLGDFNQTIVGLSAMSGQRHIQKVYICPVCSAEQPRTVDILKVFLPIKPEVEGGKTNHKFSLSDGAEFDVECRNIRVKDFIQINDMIDKIKEDAVRTIGARRVMDLTKIKREYGDIFDFADEDDVEDFCSQLSDIGLIALRIECNKMEFKQRLQWLMNLQGNDVSIFNDLSKKVMSLSADMSKTYKTRCTNKECRNEFSAQMESTDYFFGLRPIS